MVRVLQSLENSVFKSKLKSKIPKDVFTPPDVKHKYPQLLLKCLPRTYFDLGILTEVLLQKSNIQSNDIQQQAKSLFNADIPDNVLSAKSTKDYINNVNTTKLLILSKTNETLTYNKELSMPNCPIKGHPDILTTNHVFEVKTSGRLKESWSQFIIQSFCYVALSNAKTLHIVLPLQAHVHTINTQNWPKRQEFIDLMKQFEVPSEDYALAGKVLLQTFQIGSHVQKKTKLLATVTNLTPKIPYQIFLSKSSKIVANDEDIAATLGYVSNNNIKVFVHAPYILNLCDKKDYIVPTLVDQLNVASACGFRGVVVHVGKSVKLPVQQAIQNMKENIIDIFQQVSTSSLTCDLLLETPAGQGTEVLTTCQEFMTFVESIPRLKACMDTCHVFAAGTLPHEYMNEIASKKEWRERLKLIHFNDSETELNSKVDRHAMPGKGKIPFECLIHCAKLAYNLKIPMLTE